jgi:putative radical SAM enzyme (TIGR03279 family)
MQSTRAPSPSRAAAPPRVVAVRAGSAAARAGLVPGDEVLSLNGEAPRDVIGFRLLADEPDLSVLVRRGGSTLAVAVAKEAGEPLGAEVSSAVFDRVRTCDNHCAFCFIHQLPPGMRRSLSLKDDDYRLSFLYGNFTTLTRFTEMDLERVVSERLGPLFVSIHATDPDIRAQLLRNRRGATSLRWLAALLDAGIEVHGQVVVCPGVNDGAVLEDTLAGVLDAYPRLATVACVPLGVSRYSTEPSMRPHTPAEAAAVCARISSWQEVFESALGRRMVYAADEYYLLAGESLPPADHYDGFPQHENGIGMARAFEAAFAGDDTAAFGVRPGFFAWVDGAPAAGYRALRAPAGADRPGAPRRSGAPGAGRPVTIVTGTYGAEVLRPLLAAHGYGDVEVLAVANDHFGGNIGVAGLLTGGDVARALAGRPDAHRYLLPDACLSEGRFLDDLSLDDLPVAVEVVPADGRSLRHALEAGEAGEGGGRGGRGEGGDGALQRPGASPRPDGAATNGSAVPVAFGRRWA